MAELCKEFELHPTQINDWKRQLLERAADVFGSGTAPDPVDLAPLHAKIGQLALENDFLESRAHQVGVAERFSVVDREHPLSVARPAKLLDISRSAVYDRPRPISDADLALMRRIDVRHLEHPFMGAPMLQRALARQGIHVGRRHLGASAWVSRYDARSRVPASVIPSTMSVPICRASRTYTTSRDINVLRGGLFLQKDQKMMALLKHMAAVLLLVLTVHSQAQESRPKNEVPGRISLGKAHALVVGNGAYTKITPLANPANDANTISATLRSMGFEVTTLIDVTRQQLIEGLSQYSQTAKASELSVFFWSGHGVSLDGEPYILPTDLAADSADQVGRQGISLPWIISNHLPGKTKLVFFDSDLANPFRAQQSQLMNFTLPSNTLVSFATGAGELAFDGVGSSKNSPYTAALSNHLTEAIDIGTILRKVRQSVWSATGEKQMSWEYGNLTTPELILNLKIGQR
jgi:transposase-like protein